MKYELNSQLGT